MILHIILHKYHVLRPHCKIAAIQPHFIIQGAVKAWIIIANFHEIVINRVLFH